jgi:alpha-2-macroglobulin
MVPFGDLTDREPPFDVTCAMQGKSRWIDSVTWAYDFEKPLSSGMRCSFTLRQNVKAVDGRAVSGQRTFEFSTGGPAIVESRPWPGDESIDEQQIFLFSLDGEVDTASVRSNVRFTIEGLPERVEADVVEGAELEQILAGLSKWQRPEPPLVALRARRTFPNGRKIRLEWGKGVRSKSGEATTTAQTFEYKSRPSFSATVSCRRENARSGCVPILPITVSFASPVPLAMAEAVRLVGPDGAPKPPAPSSEDEKKEGFTQSLVFAAPFAESQTYTVQMPAELRDDAGRALPSSQAKSLTVKTGPLPVLAKFAAGFGILERNADPALPVTLRSIEPRVAASEVVPVSPPGPDTTTVQGSDLRVTGEDPKQILDWLRRVSLASRRKSVFTGTPAAAAGARTSFAFPKPNPTKELEVVGVPMPKAGLHIVEIQSPLLGAALLGQQKPMFVATAALVTNLAVHFKQGREGSIAWVTTLEEAEPVAGARVVASDCNGRELGIGETDANGVARFAAIPSMNALPSCWPQWNSGDEENQDSRDYSSIPALSGMASGILVVARTADDMSFVHSSWDSGIEPWRFQLRSSGWGDSDLVVHTIFDRPLYRAGETVHMKALLRSKSMAGFGVPDEARRPTKLVVEFTAMQQRHEIPVVFDAAGVATAEWQIPATARLGSYGVTFEGTGNQRMWGGSFRVEQFRVPLVRGEVVAPPVVPPRAPSVDVDIGVQYLAGGAASRLPVILRSQLHPGSFDVPDDYAAYSFAVGAVRDGIETEDGSHDEEEGARPHRQYEAELDEAGGARITVGELPVVDRPTSLVLEAEFRDPNGEVETVATSRTLLPAGRVPGIRVDDWTKAEDLVKPHVAVLTPEGRPASGTPVRIAVLKREWFSYRKRLVGGFYGYESTSGTRRIGTLCEGTTDGNGLFECAVKPPEKGQLVLEATVTDEGGHTAATQTSVWVPGDDDGFDTSDDDRIDVVPERKSYEPGETARLQVRMPFREATALVTVEREGVGDVRIVRLRAEDPVVEVPITDAHAPNVFVSVLAVRGRVGDVQPTAMLDLGRPAFKLGIAEIRVDWKTHRLGVSVRSDRETYQVREKARVAIAVTRHDGTPPPEGSEVAVAAVDEGLLELLPNESWNVLDAMMSVRGYEVSTSTAQGQVIGKRHYGRKAVATGGGGGDASSPSRELFDTLLFWSSRVKLDAEGKAEVEVPLNDSLTAFRIVAIATGGAGEFGDGAATIRSTRELATYSGLPPMVREGDTFTAEFTLRNTGARALDVMVNGSVEAMAGAAAAGSGTAGAATAAAAATSVPPPAVLATTPLSEQRVALAPVESRTLTWPASVPKGSKALAWKLTAGAEGASDSLIARQRVEPALPVQVVQATLAQLDGSAAMPVAAPPGADTAAAGSGIVVSGAASLGDSVAPMKDWLARYPYTCLEQKVSIAIGREDDAAWQTLVGEMESYVDASGLLMYFPGQHLGDDRLTAYVLAISHAAGRALPEDLSDRLTTALDGFVAGRIERSSGLDVPDRTLRKLSAIEALARYGKADESMLAGITIQPELWPTSAVLDWWSILARLPDLKDAAVRQREVENVLRARLDLSGTTLVFTTESGDRIWWMMAGADSNAVRLLLHLVEFGVWKEDAPRVLTGAVARRKGGAWETTIANAWGVVAMRRFARVFESEPVTGRTRLALGAADASIDWAAGPTPPPATLAWPPAQAELSMKQEGSGKPWITTTARAAVLRSEPVASGYRLTRTVTPIDAKSPGTWHRGDRMLVRIEIDAQRPMWWVVVDDPVPGGASHLGTGLGRGAAPLLAPAGAADAEVHDISPAFVERSQASWRAYVDYLPRGRSRVDYTIRLNQAGTFHLPPVRVEALYAPEVYGELPPATITVEP